MIKEATRFVCKDEHGEIKSEVNFALVDNVMSIKSVKTRDDQRGKGLAKEMMDEVIKHAKENNLKIIPICSYAVAYFERFPQYDYLLEEK